MQFLSMFDLNSTPILIYVIIFPYVYTKMLFTNLFCLMTFAENKNLERASYHFYSYFGTNYFDVLPLTIYFYASFWYVIWFYYCLHIFKIYKNKKNMNFQIKQF